MTDHRNDCPPVEELALIHELAKNDPRREHLSACPRCRARLATYQEFLSTPPVATAAQRSDALARLDAALEREIFGEGADAEEAERPRPGRVVRLDVRVLRAAIAVAALLILLAALDSVRDRTSLQKIVLRSEGGDARARGLVLATPQFAPDGALHLAWSVLEGADAYRVEILSAALDPLASFEAGGELSLALGPDRLQGILPGPGAYVWSVTALQNGDVLQRSLPGSFLLDLGELRDRDPAEESAP